MTSIPTQRRTPCGTPPRAVVVRGGPEQVALAIRAYGLDGWDTLAAWALGPEQWQLSLLARC